MLSVIHEKNRSVGFKAAGGVKTAEQAKAYLQLAAKTLGDDWVSARTFRFGASSLLNDLLNTLGVSHETSSSAY